MLTRNSLALPFFLVALSTSAAEAPCTVTCSQGEYAEAAAPNWTKVRDRVEHRWASLFSDATLAGEPDLAVKELELAKANWENYRDSFCKSVSTTYGGAWASTRESDCRTQIGEDFLKSAGGYSW